MVRQFILDDVSRLQQQSVSILGQNQDLLQTNCEIKQIILWVTYSVTSITISEPFKSIVIPSEKPVLDQIPALFT